MSKPLLDGKVMRSDADRDEEAAIKADGRSAAEVKAAEKMAAAGACISITLIAVLVIVPMLSALLISTATQGTTTEIEHDASADCIRQMPPCSYGSDAPLFVQAGGPLARLPAVGRWRFSALSLATRPSSSPPSSA